MEAVNTRAAGIEPLFSAEALEARTMLSGGIRGISLIDAQTGQGLMKLRDGIVINLQAFDARELDLRARVRSAVEGVHLRLNGDERRDKSRWFSWRKNAAANWRPKLGEHTLEVSALGNRRSASRPVTVRFTIIDQPLPQAPAAFSAEVGSENSVRLSWEAIAEDDTDIRLMRSVDGKTWMFLAALDEGATEFIDSGVEAGKTYFYQVRTRNIAGRSPGAVTAPIHVPGGDVHSSPFAQLPQSAVDAAIAHPLIRYNRYIAGGAHTNQPANGGAPIILALAAYGGNTTADERLLQQIRYTLTGGNEITANGGYPAQHERIVETMFLFVRQTPRIWEQLSEIERGKIDLIMKAAFVASAFTTGDNNPYVKAGTQQYGLDGNNALSRTWNPNYREGMIGGVLVGIAWLGGADAAGAFLQQYNHSAFTQQLQSVGLSNLHQTFNWKVANPTSTAPSGEVIETAIRDYRYFGRGLDNAMGIYQALTDHTFGKIVSPGLNGGLGYNGGGMILSGADTLPNRGLLGMLAEFDSNDANGARSSARYSYDGFRTHMANHLVMVLSGLWDEQHPGAADMLRKMTIGATDLWYKLDHGYSNFAKGVASGTIWAHYTGEGFEFHRPLWEGVVGPMSAAA